MQALFALQHGSTTGWGVEEAVEEWDGRSAVRYKRDSDQSCILARQGQPLLAIAQELHRRQPRPPSITSHTWHELRAHMGTYCSITAPPQGSKGASGEKRENTHLESKANLD